MDSAASEALTHNPTRNVSIAVTSSSAASSPPSSLPSSPPPSPLPSPPDLPPHDCCVYWQSTKARMLFKPWEDESVYDGIKKQIDTLTSIHDTYQSITNVIDGPGDIKEVLTDHQIMKICQKCQLLALSLNFALKHMHKWKNWDKCCNEAIGIGKKIGLTANPKVI